MASDSLRRVPQYPSFPYFISGIGLGVHVVRVSLAYLREGSGNWAGPVPLHVSSRGRWGIRPFLRV